MFCKHKWKLLDKERVKSKFEIIIDSGERTDTAHPSMLNSVTIITLACEDCGKLKIIKQSN